VIGVKEVQLSCRRRESHEGDAVCTNIIGNHPVVVLLQQVAVLGVRKDRRGRSGRALITGKWRDSGNGKGPILRGLASRAPYLHNGSAATLADVMVFYDMRFNIGFTPQEKADLIAFLNSLSAQDVMGLVTLVPCAAQPPYAAPLRASR